MKKLITTLVALGLATLALYVFGPLRLNLPGLAAQARLQGHSFKVEIEGVDAGQFKSVSGLKVEAEVVEVLDPAAGTTRKRPGRVKYGDITLKRGVTGESKGLYNWFQDTVAAPENVQRKNMSIILFDPVGKELARYNLFECFPRSWEGPAQVTESSALAIEKIEIAIEKVERAR